MSPAKVVALENELNTQILNLTFQVAKKWNLDAEKLLETILFRIHNRSHFYWPHSRGYDALSDSVWKEYCEGLKVISSNLADEFMMTLSLKINDSNFDRKRYWSNMDEIFHSLDGLEADTLKIEKIEKTIEIETQFSKSKNIRIEQLYEELAALVDFVRDMPWNESFVPRKYAVLDDDIVLEFLSQLKGVWPTMHSRLVKEYKTVRKLDFDWRNRYDRFYAKNLKTLVAFEEDVKRHSFNIPEHHEIWQQYLEGKRAWGLDPKVAVIDQLQSNKKLPTGSLAKAFVSRATRFRQASDLILQGLK